MENLSFIQRKSKTSGNVFQLKYILFSKTLNKCYYFVSFLIENSSSTVIGVFTRVFLVTAESGLCVFVFPTLSDPMDFPFRLDPTPRTLLRLTDNRLILLLLRDPVLLFLFLRVFFDFFLLL